MYMKPGDHSKQFFQGNESKYPLYHRRWLTSLLRLLIFYIFRQFPGSGVHEWKRIPKPEILGQVELAVTGWLSPFPHHPTSLGREAGKYPRKIVGTNRTSVRPAFPTR